jgi:hypothetical protein
MSDSPQEGVFREAVIYDACLLKRRGLVEVVVRQTCEVVEWRPPAF